MIELDIMSIVWELEIHGNERESNGFRRVWQ